MKEVVYWSYIVSFFIFFIIMFVFQSRVIKELDEKHKQHKHIHKQYEEYKKTFLLNSNSVIFSIFCLVLVPFFIFKYLDTRDLYYTRCDYAYIMLFFIFFSFIFFISGIVNLQNLLTLLNNDDLSIASNLQVFLASVYYMYLPSFSYLTISTIKFIFGYGFLLFNF